MGTNSIRNSMPEKESGAYQTSPAKWTQPKPHNTNMIYL